MRAATLLISGFLFLLPGLAAASPSDLDSTFGDMGKRIIIPDQRTYSSQLRLRPDGRIVALVNTTATNSVVQLNPDGAPDLQFGSGTGKVSASEICARFTSCFLSAIQLQADGKILVAIGIEARVYAVARLLDDGRLDPSFGVNGTSTISPSLFTGSDYARGIVVQQDGKIVLGGDSANVDGTTLSAARFLADGSPDIGFGTSGRLKLATKVLGVGSFLAQPDGKLLWAGGTIAPRDYITGTLVARALVDGTLDASFATDGVYQDASLGPFFLTIESDGKLLVAGSMVVDGMDQFAVMRLNSAGLVDNSFGNGGLTVLTIRPGRSSRASAIALDSVQRIVIVGTVTDRVNSPFGIPQLPMLEIGVARFTTDGSPDLTFGPHGSTAFWSGFSSRGHDVAIATGDRILVAGTTEAAPFKVPLNWLRNPQPTLFRLQGGSSSVTQTLYQERAIEYYHAGFNHYFISSTPSEIAGLDTDSPQWTRSGKSFPVWTEDGQGLLPVCRFFSDQSFAPKSSHFYTPYAAECAGLRAGSVWKYEGNVFNLGLPIGAPGSGTCLSGTAPLYRLYNSGQGGAPNHRYTIDSAIVDQMISTGWVFEGEAQTRVFACVPATLN